MELINPTSPNAFSIHGHFYQPPREDPLTGEIPIEPGAAPNRNWNEKIDSQCYAPNARLGNFEHISFNIGPTLVEWMEGYDLTTLNSIIAQDRVNLERYGVGNAMAQAYNHTILPLATRNDKMTQVTWGIIDFERRFGHKPLGMWLPETAVDYETLEVLADCGIEFTILAPWQADGDRLDASNPYIVPLNGGRKINVFFYDQDLSTRVSFDPGSTANADSFLYEKILPKFHSDGSDKPNLVMIASDGELYGHHQPFRDQFLAYLMDSSLKKSTIRPTYPALWLKENPPVKTIDIRENTSWSCSHGVVRWMGTCSCTPNGEWKASLRLAMNFIASRLDDLYEDYLKQYVEDPWQLRHQYIRCHFEQTCVADLASSMAGKKLEPEVISKIELLLQAQYERQRIYTSCGWFFDDFDRIEPRNNVAYAAQAIWLTYLATGVDISKRAADWLKPVKSWRSGIQADAVFNHHLQRAQKTQQIRKSK